jgi:hypothetical protein
MYIENKSGSLNGGARIGRVTFSKTMRSMFYGGKEFGKTKSGYKYNCIELGSRDEYWISGCKKDGTDRLYGGNVPVYIDEDVREEYWVSIRNLPQFKLKETSN